MGILASTKKLKENVVGFVAKAVRIQTNEFESPTPNEPSHS